MARRAPAKSKAAPTLGADTRILVLQGKEAMLGRAYLDQLRQALEAAYGQVDTFTFDGKTASLADVLDEVRAYSLMMRHKLVLVDDAEPFVKTHRAALERYADKPVDHAALVLRAGTWNKGNLDKKIAKVGEVIACKPLGEAEAGAWLIRRAAEAHQATLDRRAAGVLVDRLGTDLSRLDSELGKVALLAEPGKPVTAQMVEQVVGKSSDEQAWAAQEAILESLQHADAGKAIAAIHELVDLAGQPEVLVAYFVTDLMRKFAVASLMKQARMPEMQIARNLKLFGPRQRLFMNVLRRLDTHRASKLFEQAVTLDARAKSGLGNPMRNLERLCVLLGQLAR